MLIPVTIVAFAMLDATLAGFREAAGRDGRIVKTTYYRRAMAAGAVMGALNVAALAMATAALLAISREPAALWNELVRIGGRMILVFAGFAALVLSSLGVYAVSKHEMRTLATVAILGPFTLARPFVVIGATIYGTWSAANVPAIVLTWVSSVAVLGVGTALGRYFARQRTPTVAPTAR